MLLYAVVMVAAAVALLVGACTLVCKAIRRMAWHQS